MSAPSALVALVALVAAGASQAASGGHDSNSEVLAETGWQAFNLLVVVALLVYFGRKPVTQFFAARRQAIQAQLAQAADLLAQAEHRNSELQRRLVDEGFPLRIYLPFGSQWYPYLTRRLAERPANAWFFLRAALGS